MDRQAKLYDLFVHTVDKILNIRPRKRELSYHITGFLESSIIMANVSGIILSILCAYIMRMSNNSSLLNAPTQTFVFI